MTDYHFDSAPSYSYRPSPAPSASSYSPSPASTPSPTVGSPSRSTATSYDNAGYGTVLSLQKDFCQNFACCGLALADMHELIEHFEDSHAFMLPEGHAAYPTLVTSSASFGYSQSPSPSSPASYPYSAAEASFSQSHSQSPHPGRQYSAPPTPYGYTYAYSPVLGLGIEDEYDPFGFSCSNITDPSSSKLESHSAFSSPLLPPPSSASSSSGSSVYDYSSAPSPFTPGSPVSSGSVYSSPSLGDCGSLPKLPYAQSPIFAPQPVHPRAQSMSTTSLTMIERQGAQHQRSNSASSAHSLLQRRRSSQDPYAIPPSLSRSRTQEKCSTGSTQRSEKLTSEKKEKKGVEKSKKSKDGRVKAYRCPHPGCTKAYLNPNGLKYHLEKGTCSIDPAYVPVCTVLPSQSQPHATRA